MSNSLIPKSIKAIVGLGNPGPKYQKNRHNVGFRVLDALAERFSVQWQTKEELEFCELISNQERVLLLKPLTYMNSSGRTMTFLAKKGVKPQEILVVHDELEKPFGYLGFRFAGSAKGHNGLRSIIGAIGDQFWRLCFGIGRPLESKDVGDYVLSNFSAQEEEQLEGLVLEAVKLICDSFQNN